MKLKQGGLSQRCLKLRTFSKIRFLAQNLPLRQPSTRLTAMKMHAGCLRSWRSWLRLKNEQEIWKHDRTHKSLLEIHLRKSFFSAEALLGYVTERSATLVVVTRRYLLKSIMTGMIFMVGGAVWMFPFLHSLLLNLLEKPHKLHTFLCFPTLKQPLRSTDRNQDCLQDKTTRIHRKRGLQVTLLINPL